MFECIRWLLLHVALHLHVPELCLWQACRCESRREEFLRVPAAPLSSGGSGRLRHVTGLQSLAACTVECSNDQSCRVLHLHSNGTCVLGDALALASLWRRSAEGLESRVRRVHLTERMRSSAQLLLNCDWLRWPSADPKGRQLVRSNVPPDEFGLRFARSSDSFIDVLNMTDFLAQPAGAATFFVKVRRVYMENDTRNNAFLSEYSTQHGPEYQRPGFFYENRGKVFFFHLNSNSFASSAVLPLSTEPREFSVTVAMDNATDATLFVSGIQQPAMSSSPRNQTIEPDAIRIGYAVYSNNMLDGSLLCAAIFSERLHPEEVAEQEALC